MAGGVGDDRVADLTGTALACGAPRRVGTGAGEPAKQGVADALELDRPGDPRFRRVQQRWLLQRLEVEPVARQLRLEAADLAVQLSAGGELVDLEP